MEPVRIVPKKLWVEKRGAGRAARGFRCAILFTKKTGGLLRLAGPTKKTRIVLPSGARFSFPPRRQVCQIPSTYLV
jgi:hypothetical protein